MQTYIDDFLCTGPELVYDIKKSDGIIISSIMLSTPLEELLLVFTSILSDGLGPVCRRAVLLIVPNLSFYCYTKCR